MIKNCQHNLIHQLSETMDSLWRMDNYIEDAKESDCSKGVNFWENYKKTLENQISLLKDQLEEVIKEEGLDTGNQ